MRSDRLPYLDTPDRNGIGVSEAYERWVLDLLGLNTYKVLMTRGMRGTILYAVDPETRALLTTLVQTHRSLETVYK